jgi:hypothetical protein
MSIINEALKKTEEYLQKNATQDNPLPPKPTAPKPFLLYILILLAGLLLGNFIFNLLSHKLQGNGLASNSTQVHGLSSFRQSQAESHKIQTTQTPKKNTLPAIQTTNSPPAAALPSQPPEEKKPKESSFVLNGIFFSDNDGYALVNNQIVRENDYVDGAKVGLITPNTVELDNAGQTITLSTHR